MKTHRRKKPAPGDVRRGVTREPNLHQSRHVKPCPAWLSQILRGVGMLWRQRAERRENLRFARAHDGVLRGPDGRPLAQPLGKGH